MSDRSKHRRVLARARHLPPDVFVAAPGAVRPDAVRARSSALAPLWLVTWPTAVGLAVLAALAPSWTGTGAAWLLAGLPAAALLALAILGRAARRRRVCMVLATSACGFLALATVGSLGALGAEAGRAVHYQVGCFALAALHLAVALPVWRRTNAAGDAAEAAASLHDEL